jgi:transposase
MSERARKGGIDPAAYDVFVGLDVDKRNMSVRIEDGETAISKRMPHDWQSLNNYLDKHYSGKRIAIAYEAGGTGFGMYDGFKQEGKTCLVAAPAMIPRAPGERVKTNRLDAQKICDNLRGGQLKGIRVPSTVYRDLRHLVTLRDGQTQEMKSAKYRICGLLLCEGLQPGEPLKWTRADMAVLRQFRCRPIVRFNLDGLLASLDYHRKQVFETTRMIRQYCRQQPELKESVELLLSIPGLGQITATHLVARIGDWRKMRNVRELAAFVGLVASEFSTGEHVRRGPITRMGDERLRSKLLQVAWVSLRKDPELKEFFHRIRSRNPQDRASRTAIIAVARKLTTRIYAVLTKRRPYQIRLPHPARVAEEITAPAGRLDACQKRETAFPGFVFKEETGGGASLVAS